jgi:hypothetical protein
MDERKEPMIALRREHCLEWLEDYNECLHREKEVNIVAAGPSLRLLDAVLQIILSVSQRTRRQVVERERRAQLAGGSKPAGGGH